MTESAANVVKPDLKGRFESASRMLAVLASVLLVLSVVHDFSFLLALNLTFASVPTTIGDHVRSAIIWAPPYIACSVAGLVFGIFSRNDSGQSPAKRTMFEIAVKRAAPLIAFALPALLVAGPWMVAYMVFIILWIEFLGDAVTKRLGLSGSAVWLQLTIAVGPATIVFIGSLGYLSGDNMLRASAPRWTALVKTEAGTEQRSYLGLRRFESSVVAVDLDRKVHVLRADQLVEVDSVVHATAFESFGCTWFGVACLKPVIVPAGKPGNAASAPS